MGKHASILILSVGKCFIVVFKLMLVILIALDVNVLNMHTSTSISRLEESSNIWKILGRLLWSLVLCAMHSEDIEI